MTPEERLLKEIFAKDDAENNGPEWEMPDNYPATYLDKADYALFCLHKSLQSISPALERISRLCGLLRVSEKDGKNTLPDIITHNESRIALTHLSMVKRDVDDACQEILSIFENTKEPGAVSETERVGQDPEPPGEEVEGMNKREAILEANRIGGLVNTILLTVFLVLKLAGLITWPWVLVLAPLWALVCLVVLFVIV